jgi:hypothetical protein
MSISGSSRVILGVGLGIAIAGTFRQIAPAFRGLGRPLAKAAVKSTLLLLDRGRLQVAELKETVEDLAAEVRVEIKIEARRQAAQESEPEVEEHAAQSAYQA